MKDEKAKKSGMGIVGILTLIFVVLKITNNIDWSWLWVLSPIWVSVLLFCVIFTTILILGRIKKGQW